MRPTFAVAILAALGFNPQAFAHPSIQIKARESYPTPSLGGGYGGKGRNKTPRLASGVAAAKRAAAKRRNVARHKHNARRART